MRVDDRMIRALRLAHDSFSNIMGDEPNLDTFDIRVRGKFISCSWHEEDSNPDYYYRDVYVIVNDDGSHRAILTGHPGKIENVTGTLAALNGCVVQVSSYSYARDEVEVNIPYDEDSDRHFSMYIPSGNVKQDIGGLS